VNGNLEFGPRSEEEAVGAMGPAAGAWSSRGSRTEPRLSVEQARYSYAAAQRAMPAFSLLPMSMAAWAGELVAILGPNASGKTTLLKLMAGAMKPLAGHVTVEGFEVSQIQARTRAQRIAMVQQESTLLFPIRSWEFVMQGRYPHGRRLRFDSAADCELVTEMLEQAGVSHLRDRWMSELSGGEKQRVILARALVQQPALLLLDEPTQHLDIGAKVELMQLLRKLADTRRHTIVMVTHELNLAAEFADRVAMLHKGRCLDEGPPEKVYDRERLEMVFDAPLSVTLTASGRPRVTLRGGREPSISGLAGSPAAEEK
jgi:iron complex transport system ATP-binding protein